MDEERNSQLINLTADIVAAHVANHSVAVSDVPVMIQAIHAALSGLGKTVAVAEAPQPAVPVRASVKPDYIICLEDGRKLKTLKRHLMAHYGMTPADYRAKWGLPASYPMVAPRYAEARRSIAKAVGLGRRTAAVKEPAPQPAKAPAPKAAAPKAAAPKPVKEPAAQPAKTAAPKAAVTKAATPAKPVKQAVTKKTPAANEPAAKQPAKAKGAVRTGRGKRGTAVAKA